MELLSACSCWWPGTGHPVNLIGNAGALRCVPPRRPARFDEGGEGHERSTAKAVEELLVTTPPFSSRSVSLEEAWSCAGRRSARGRR